MKIKKLLPFTLAFVIAGCVPSLHSLFTEKDIFFEPGLVGRWSSSENSKEIWQFTKKGETKTYEVTYTDNNGDRGSFTGTLGKINETIFLDLFPNNSETEIRSNDFYKAHLIPAHTFLKIEQITPILKMQAMDPDKFGKMIRDDPNIIKHEVLADDNRVVITASTQEIQQFMKKYANEKELFGEPTELKRLIPAEPNSPDTNNISRDSNNLPVK